MRHSGRTLLAIEAATDWLSVALLEGDELRASASASGLRRHAAELLPAIAAVLEEAAASVGSLDAIAVSSGPGSFTSLRIALATVKGLAFGRPIETIGVSTLETMAAAAIARPEREGGLAADERVLTLLDARRGEAYAGGFVRGPDGLPECVLAEGLYRPEPLAADLAGQRLVLVSPERAAWCAGFVSAGLEVVREVGGEAARPRAEWLGRVARIRLDRGEGGPARALAARYLRRAQAEAERLGAPVEPGELARVDEPPA